MDDHTDVAMEATFEEEGQPPQTSINQSPDAPTAEKEATSFFDNKDEDEEDDGFGDFEDVAWEEAPETTILTDPTPPPPLAAAVAVATSAPIAAASGNQQDVLHLEPAAFLDAATATMARFSHLRHKEKELIRNITTLKDLKNKFPQLRQNGGSSTITSFSWKGSISQARLLHRLNLGPAPVVDSLLSQPPANRAASLRPTSSGSLYTSAAPTVAAFPAPPPPAKQQRSVLAPPPPPPPPPQPQTSSVFVAAPPPPEPAPIIDPFSDTADLVDTMIPLTIPAAEVPEGHQQPLDSSADELVRIEEPSPLVVEEEQQRELEEPQDDEHFDVEASPPYQNPFMSTRTQEIEEESEKDASLVVDEKVETEHEDTCAYNKDKEVEEVEHGIKHTSLNDSVENDQIQEEEGDGKIELEEDVEKEFDPFEEAAIAPGVEIIKEEKEWVNPFEVPEEKVVAEEEEKEEFADEFEWAAAAASPSSVAVEDTTTTTVDDIDVLSLETESVAKPPVMEALEKSQAESEQEEQGKVNVPLTEESLFIEEGSEKKATITVVEEEGITNQEEEDDFDDFCEADATLAKTEKEEKEAVPTASEVVENLAATLPDLSFMLSDSLVKPNTP